MLEQASSVEEREQLATDLDIAVGRPEESSERAVIGTADPATADLGFAPTLSNRRHDRAADLARDGRRGVDSQGPA